MNTRISFEVYWSSSFRNATASMARLVLCLAICILGLAVSAGAQKPKIITFDAPGAGTGPGQGTWAFWTNPSGTTTGMYIDANYVNHGFLRARDGTFTTIDAPGAGAGPGQGTASEMNHAGTIAGQFVDADNVAHGYVRTARGKFTEFDAPDAGTGPGQGTWALDINMAGAISGFYVDANDLVHSFVRDPRGTITEFDAPGAGAGPGQGTGVGDFLSINEAGTVTGYYFDTNYAFHGYLRARDGTFTVFDAPGAGADADQGTHPFTINPAGAVTGFYWDSSYSFVWHGFLRTPEGAFILFDVPGAGTDPYQGTLPYCINPAGAITGVYVDATSVVHGFLRAADGTITVFDVPGAATFTATQTINEAGTITGGYNDANGVVHGFVRTP